MCSVEEGMQYDGGFLQQRRHAVSTEEGVQHGSVTPSVQRRHIISTMEGRQCKGGYTLQMVCQT